MPTFTKKSPGNEASERHAHVGGSLGGGTVTTACSRCDRTPAAGFAHLDHKRYCQHEDPGA